MAAALVIAKAILEVAVLALIAQFLVGVFAWGRRDTNVVYKLFALIASPFTRLVRRVTPRLVVDGHIPLATFFLLGFAWIFVVVNLRSTCLADPAQRACPPLAATATAQAR